MSAAGPDLPPHLLAKRKRKQEEEAAIESSTNSGAKRSVSSDGTDKRQRIVGPAMPPAPLDERPQESARPTKAVAEDSDDSDDEDFGPTLPTADSSTHDQDGENANDPEPSGLPLAEAKLKRDDWMMMPPKQDDLAARLDPTRQRPTKFNAGKAGRSAVASDGDSSVWHETPEQKQKRLQDEMMGITKVSISTGSKGSMKSTKSVKDDAADHTIKKHVEKARGPSLLEQHKESKGREAEDDPSSRAFDREKDMGTGARISSSDKRQLLNKAAGLSGRFSKGSY